MFPAWRSYDNAPAVTRVTRFLHRWSCSRSAQEVLTLEEEESAVDATEEHDDDAHQRVETPINIVSQYLQILCLIKCVQANKP